MDDWKSKIVTSFAEHDLRRSEIHTTLNRLIMDLREEKGISSATIEQSSEYPLAWNVAINKKVFGISEREILESQVLYEENGLGEMIKSKEKKGLEDALQELLVKKFDF